MLIALHIILFSLLTVMPGVSQSFHQGKIEERLFISTDREVYFPGQEVYIKIWHKNIQGFEPSGLIYLELKDIYGGENYLSRIIISKNGGAATKFRIPEDLPSTFYQLRAYTAWMKNYGTESFAIRKIMVLNPALNDSFKFPYLENSNDSSPEAEFFPVGGKLSAGMNNRVYVKFRNFPEKALDGAFVTNNQMDTLAILEKLDRNHAFFDFFPSRIEQYELRIPAIFPHPRLELPEVNVNNVRLIMDEIPGGFRFKVQTNDTSLNLNELKISVKNLRNKNSEESEIRIDADDFLNDDSVKAGMNRFSLENKEGKVLSELYFLIAEKPGFRVTEESGFTETGGNITQPRDTVNIDLFTRNPEGKAISPILNIYIREKLPDILSQNDPANYVHYGDYLDLQPGWDLRSPVYRTALAEIYGRKAFNLDESVPERVYKRDTDEFVIRGRFNNANTRGKRIYLSFPGDSSQIFITTTDEEGNFSFKVPTVDGRRESYFKTDDNINEGYISLEESFYPGFDRTSNFPRSFDPEMLDMFNNWFREWRFTSYYREEEVEKKSGHSEFHFYDETDFRVDMDNYIEFPNMEEVFFEIIKPTMIFRENNEPYLKVIDRETNRTLGDNVLYLIDGVPFTEPSYAFQLNPNVVKDIAVIARRYFIASEIYDGIVILNTRSGDLSPLDPEMVVFRKQISYTEKGFHQYEKPVPSSSNIPFNPSVIYWNPSVKTSKEGSFSFSFIAPDREGDYEICVEAYDLASGKFVYKTFNFRVEGKTKF